MMLEPAKQVEMGGGDEIIFVNAGIQKSKKSTLIQN